jgi:hypothetical protein
VPTQGKAEGRSAMKVDEPGHFWLTPANLAGDFRLRHPVCSGSPYGMD